jgi:hypothetical protein
VDALETSDSDDLLSEYPSQTEDSPVLRGEPSVVCGEGSAWVGPSRLLPFVRGAYFLLRCTASGKTQAKLLMVHLKKEISSRDERTTEYHTIFLGTFDMDCSLRWVCIEPSAACTSRTPDFSARRDIQVAIARSLCRGIFLF